MKFIKLKSTIHLYLIYIILMVGTIAVGFGMILYNITIHKPDGSVEISNWPIKFTDEFSDYIIINDNMPRITQSGIQLLHENNLWIQLIDINGDEIKNYNKPNGIASHYSPFEIIDIYQNGITDYSVFFGDIQSKDNEWTYIIGFPFKISKITYYSNGDRFTTLKPIVLGMLGVTLFLLILSGIVYGYIIAKQVKQIRKSIKDISARNYIPVINKGSFSDIYNELNLLNYEIKSNDDSKIREEKLREEWIANITHDLKTPLSPIKGYVELISSSDLKIDNDELRKYGNIIRKNLVYTEELINDLKITYQLKNEMLPLNRSRQNIVRFIKDLMIDLLNNPEYRNRNVSYIGTNDEIELCFDTMLLKRAFNNILINALIHNSRETAVYVSIKKEDCICIKIQDNGEGIKKEDLEHLFNRYYRGEKMTVKTEGSGLGMAIAKQIVELHGGIIKAESEQGFGTSVVIEFP